MSYQRFPEIDPQLATLDRLLSAVRLRQQRNMSELEDRHANAAAGYKAAPDAISRVLADQECCRWIKIQLLVERDNRAHQVTELARAMSEDQ